MENRAHFLVSKAVLDFLRDFMRLNEALLTSTRSLMKDTVSEAMDIVMSAGAVPNEEGKARQLDQTSDLQQISNLFSKDVEAVCAADKRLGQLLSSLMGVVSTDDIIQQRMNHVLFGVRRFNSALVAMIQGQQVMTIEGVANFRNLVLSDVYQSYTTNEEREIFHQIFGRPKRIKALEAA